MQETRSGVAHLRGAVGALVLRRPVLTAAIVASVLALWVEWRVVAHPRSLISSDPDVSLFVWSMGHAPRQVLHGRNPFLTDAIFATTGGANLAYNATAPALALLMAPVTYAAGAVASVNALAVLTPILNTVAARHLIGVVSRARGLAPLVGALAIGFSPLVLMHLGGRFQIAFQAVVLLLLAQLCQIGRRWMGGFGLSPRRAAVAGGLTGLQLWIGTELLAIAAIVALIGLVIAVAAHPRPWKHRPERRDVVSAATALAVVLIVAAPFLVAFAIGREAYPDSYHVPARPMFGLRLANATTPTDVQAIESPPLSVDRGSLGTFPDEDTGYVSIGGLVLVVATAIGWRRLDGLRRGALIMFGVAWLLALGPTIRWTGSGSGGLPGPWRAVEALPVLQEIVANRLCFGMFVAIGVLIATTRAGRAGEPGTRLDGVARAAALVCLPVLLLPARADRLHAVSSSADDALRDQCRGELAITMPQTREQDGMAWQARADFDFALLRGFAFRQSSDPKGALTLLDAGADGQPVDPGATIAELDALGVGCVLAEADSTTVVANVAAVLGPPQVTGDVAIWSRSQGVLVGS